MMSFDQDSMSGPSLKDLVVETLQSNGVLGKIQAELKASVYLTLEEEIQQRSIPLVDKTNAELLASPVGKLSLSIVKDFITCLGLEFTSSVFESEANISSFDDLTPRKGLLDKFNLCSDNDNDQTTPVIFQMIKDLQNSSEKNSIESQISYKKNTESDLSSKELRSNEELLINLNISNESSHEESAKKSSVNGVIENDSNEHRDNIISQRDTDDQHSNPSLDSHNGYDEEFATITESEQKGSGNVDITENIEEDISINDSIGSLSEMTDTTKDYTASEKTDLCDYREKL